MMRSPSWTLTAAAVALLAISAMADDSFFSAPAVDCGSRSDGFYARGCSSSFDACVAGTATKMDCPALLVFDEANQQCEYPGNVEACGGQAPETTEQGSGIEEGSGSEGSGSEGSGDLEGSGEGSGEIEDVTGLCVDRADGFYRLSACGSAFLGCSGGVAWRMGCPASLKYDEDNQICDYPGNVEGCSESEGSGEEGSGSEEVEGSGSEDGSGEGSGIEGSGEGSGIEGSGSEEGSGSGDDVTIEEKQIEADEIIVTSRDRKTHHEQTQAVEEIDTQDDIIHSNSYGNEVDEEVEEQEEVKEIEAEDDIIVPDSVTVDEKEAAAEVKELEAEDDLIEEKAPEEEQSYGEKVADDETEEFAPSTTTTVAVAAPATSAALHDDSDDSAVPSCEGRADGFYALGCSSEMLACSNGLPHIMPCPTGLVFDERNQMCDYPAHVAVCSARDALFTEDSLLTGNDEVSPRPEIPRARDSEATTVAPTTSASVTDAPAAYTATTAADGPRENRRDARCKSSDGFFSLDCSREFVVCRAGVATELECGEGEAFEENGQSCVPLARHPQCYTHAIQPNDVIDEDVQMEKEADDGADLQMPIDHSFACDFEGARADSPCSDWFRLCEAGRGIEMYCLQGYLFDGQTAKCVPAGQLAHCLAQ